MAIPDNHPVSDVTVFCHSPSIGASPIAAVTYCPVRGRITRVGVVAADLITTSNMSGAVALFHPSAPATSIAVTGATISLPFASAASGQVASAVPTALNNVVEGTVISFTPSVAGGTNIPGTFFAVIARN